MPPTQQMPPTQAYPGGPPGGYPPQGYAPVPSPEPPKNKSGLIIAGALLAIAAAVGAFLLFSGGDDKKSTTLGGDDTTDLTTDVTSATLGGSSPTLSTPETGVVTTSPTEATLVITLPPTTEGPPTTATSPPDDSGVQTVTDDTGLFTVILPSNFLFDTAPIEGDAGTFAHISGSADLDAYSAENDTFGISILGAQADQMGTADDFVNQLDPGVEVCTTRTPEAGFPTAVGPASVLLLDGCGSNGTFAKVIMAIAVPEKNLILVAISQGFGPANDMLVEFTQAVFESVQAL